MSIATRCLALLAALLAALAPAAAHLLPAQTATMNIVGSDAYCVVSVPLSALRGIDDNRDGRASPSEIARHSDEIARQFNAGFAVTADGQPGLPLMTMAWPPQTDASQPDSSYIVVLHSVRFPAPPRHPMVKTSLFGTGAGEAQMTMTAKHDKRAETAEAAVLRPGAEAHIFFQSGFSVFADFVRLGIAHILSGVDHLLFLLTIIVAAAGWRYWLSMVTSFTVAHSVTLSLAAFGLVRLAPALVEPAIAASIVLMAALNLRRGAGGSPAAGRSRIATIFACGLLHGLGFASAIDAMAAQGAHRLATLAGFNLGIELGQFAFLAAVLMLAGLLRALDLLPKRIGLPTLASAVAGIAGAVMLIARALPLLPRLG